MFAGYGKNDSFLLCRFKVIECTFYGYANFLVNDVIVIQTPYYALVRMDMHLLGFKFDANDVPQRGRSTLQYIK